MEADYVGIDLHSDKFTCCFSSQKRNTTTFHLQEEHLKLFQNSLKRKTHIIFEASTNSFEFYDRLKEMEKVETIHIVNPNEVKIISKTSKKTDKVDAKKLMKLLKYQIEGEEDFLSEVYVPEEDIRALRSLFTSYKLYKKNIAQMKNRIHSLIKQSLRGKEYKGIEIDSKRTKEKIERDDKIKEIYKKQIMMLYKSIEDIKEMVKAIKEEILWVGKKYKEDIDILTTISGISVFIAIGIISDYADIKRFKNAKHFSSYLRSVPRIDSSNERRYIGKTKKDGRKLTVSLITQSLYHITKGASELRGYYLRKQEGKSKGKVRMAVVRKTLVTMYYMLKRKKYYKYMDRENHYRKMKEYERFLKKYEKTKKSS